MLNLGHDDRLRKKIFLLRGQSRLGWTLDNRHLILQLKMILSDKTITNYTIIISHIRLVVYGKSAPSTVPNAEAGHPVCLFMRLPPLMLVIILKKSMTILQYRKIA